MVVCFVQQAQRDKRSELYTRRYTSQNTATVCLPAYQPGCLSCSCLSLYLTHCLHTWVSLLLQTWLDIIYVIGLLSIGGCYSLARPFQRNTLPLLCLPIPPTTPSLASVDVFKESLSLFILLSTSNHTQCFAAFKLTSSFFSIIIVLFKGFMISLEIGLTLGSVTFKMHWKHYLLLSFIWNRSWILNLMCVVIAY